MYSAPFANPWMRPRPTATAITVSAILAAVGVGGFVAGVLRSRAAPAPAPPKEGSVFGPGRRPGSRMQGVVKALLTGGGAGQSTAEDIAIMRHGAYAGQFTSWFTREVEREVISRLKDFRARYEIDDCVPVQRVVIDPTFGATKETKWLSGTETATRQILEDLYPNGSPWNGGQFLGIPGMSDFVEAYDGSLMSKSKPDIALWRYWLWRRVMDLANANVCEFYPET